MFIAHLKTESYNKGLQPGITHGTLIENWQEEAFLKESLGQSRFIPKTHLLKKHDDLYLKPGSELEHVFKQSSPENTHGRIFGSGQRAFVSEVKDQFKPKEIVKASPQGKKYGLIEKQFLQQIQDEIALSTSFEKEAETKRYLGTTYKGQFVKKQPDPNNIGRRIMQDQNGKKLSNSCRDEDLLADFGVIPRPPLASDDDLKKSLIKEDYKASQPYTFWVDKAHDGGSYYCSQDSPNQYFGRNNKFVRTFPHYRHVLP